MVCIASRMGVITAATRRLPAIQMPIGIPMITHSSTATDVMISVSMASGQ